MLQIEMYSPGGKDAEVREASRVLIRDKHGNPLCFAAVYDDNQVIIQHLNDPGFEQILSAMGVRIARVMNRIEV